jgi:hypothetical protein
VPLTGEQIRANLTRFVARWSVRPGYERGEAQTFLNELFECYGTDRSDVAEFERFQQGGFVDLLWERVCLFEMKSATQAPLLRNHRRQALDYWRRAADPERNVPAPEYVVLCAFTKFEVWEPGRYPDAPRVEFGLEELPDRYTALLFLAGDQPVFTARQEAVTIEAVGKLADLFGRLDSRGEGDPDSRRRFVLQVVWCMFAEDLGQIPAQGFTRIVDDLIANPRRSSADDLGQLFGHLNDPSPERPAHGLYAEVPYVNGSLFRTATRIDLVPDELVVLREVSNFNWRDVQPSIFGSLLQGVFGHERQWQLGAHYTHEPEIQTIVTPTIVEPWNERIDALASYEDGKAAQADLLNFVVLDPACGSGNFLYLAYRELRRIEARLARRVEELARAEGRPEQVGLSAFFPLQNMRGIEIEQFGVDLARVTLWMGHRLAVEELELDESTLPLADLSGIRRADALQVPWPEASAIIGNPPFHGDRYIRRVLGDEYAEWLKEEFGVGIKDYCVYWFRKAHQLLEPGQRAGLVGTNSISQGRARPASLGYITEEGGVITDAISTRSWPGEATVEVSIVNWIKSPGDPDALNRMLDGVPLDEPIAPSLVPKSLAVDSAEPLEANEGRAFFGCILGAGGSGFILEEDEARGLLEKGPEWREIIRPLLVGEDLTRRPDHSPGRWVIDFGFKTLEEARAYPEALEIVRERVKPDRDRVSRDSYRRNWWRFAEPIRGMRDALEGLNRYVACPALTSGRGGYCWVESWTIGTGQATVFAFDDDYSMGILSSAIHEHWARARSSTFRTDFRYTPSSAFATLPWPQPGEAERAAIADAARRMIERRDELCLENEIGLTALYAFIRDGGFRDLAELHEELDVAVAAAYGWSAAAANDASRSNPALLELNKRILAGELPYAGPVSGQ